jgi:predicted Rossmann fold flavoprotein
MQTPLPVVVIGGGAAGFFAAIRLAALRPDLSVHIFEKSGKLLSKVRISGGGRCNVTHACFEPSELVKFYPRGKREMLGPFHRFGPGETLKWFEERDVSLKTEEDGRMFPVSDDSSTIVQTLLDEARKHKVQVHTNEGLQSLVKGEAGWDLTFTSGRKITAGAVIMAGGSSPQLWQILSALGLEIVPPVPSLFTFNIPDKRLNELAGVSVEKARITVAFSKLATEGPLLVTHWGISGPSVLKSSAWLARELAERQYTFDLEVDFLSEQAEDETEQLLRQLKTEHPRKTVSTSSPFAEIPKRLWLYLLGRAGIDGQKNWADVSSAAIKSLLQQLHACPFAVKGKSTFKDEFVTCGGVALREIDFRTFQAKRFPGLYFGGEIMDVDAVTGGFNFQHAWTSGWLAAEAIAEW